MRGRRRDWVQSGILGFKLVKGEQVVKEDSSAVLSCNTWKKVYVGEKRTLDTGSDAGRMADDDECDLNGALFIMSNRCDPHPDSQSHSE